ncbi:LytTR family DNA-binding domain-containing protein [Aquimarina sp. D1M17]|uniref:LytR/AlgR family response regulator transcription factor n=1 Tax=Aquimarina acroporae TaxID=2937283 RepID=UPI0020BF246A|nr:LytTR family DNA-binding domain-containing protein [Aquimarina acroporae]MCK8524392.1 LytTR family DNA-binding domain-containing protein [Aquimarina acroporae]
MKNIIKDPIPVVIIEDDDESSAFLASFLEGHYDNLKISGIAADIKSSVELLSYTKPELVFMDIELLDGNAFQILDNIESYNFEVIFTTAHHSYIEKAIEYYAFHFLTKPIDIVQLSEIIQRYTNLRNRLFTKQKYNSLKEFFLQSKLLINLGTEHISLDLERIVKCESSGNYTYFCTSDKKKHLASKPLKYYDSLLEKKGFFRANRQTLINIRHIKSIYRRESLILQNDEKIVISVRNRTKLSELIKNLS